MITKMLKGLLSSVAPFMLFHTRLPSACIITLTTTKRKRFVTFFLVLSQE